jgi:hypothetical protein
MTLMKAMHALIFVAACGGGGNDSPIDSSTGGEMKVFLDAPPPVPQMITISGITTERGLGGETNVAGVTMAIYANSNEATAIATTTSAADGKYMLTVTLNGAPLDGFIKATKSGYVENYMYPTEPFAASTTEASLNMITPGNRDYLNNLAGGGQTAGKGMIGLQVRDASGQPVAGATVSSTPASTYRYTNSSGLPSSNATSTAADGVAFMFNVPSGPITITATKAGMTFKAHVVVARADKFTTTSVVQ